jgi:IS5 family transposase
LIIEEASPIDRLLTIAKGRDPGMHQTKKGKQWYFGMKAHVGVDSRMKLIHSVVATAASSCMKAQASVYEYALRCYPSAGVVLKKPPYLI